MLKSTAVASLGQRRLLLPAWIKAALAANDRLKACLTLLQAAASHASHPDREPTNLHRELAAAGLDPGGLRDFVGLARRIDGQVLLPPGHGLLERLAADLATMARPIVESGTADDGGTPARVTHWLSWLQALPADRLDDAQLDALTHGGRGEADSLHRLVMDLHKRINRLAAELATEVIDGASVWDLQPEDRPRVAAFMRGLNRTAPLKFDHPGLDTSATRDGERLLLQNDIGTNDAHVLVIQVAGRTIMLTYSDLHRRRFEFFRAMLASWAPEWSGLESRVNAELNQGEAYTVGTATFVCADDWTLDSTLEGIASRIVFLIDWNRARKRLQAFVGKSLAIEVLTEAARLDVGHRAWLQLGGERLVFTAMQAVGEGAFRLGDRLDDAIGATDARGFLVSVLRLARDALRDGQPAALVADQTRMLLAQHVRQRSREFDLLAEHAAFCHALAQAVSDGLAHGIEDSIESARDLAARSKAWERQADHLVMHARDNAERQPRWREVARLVEQADDVADALEEAAFLISLVADGHLDGWNGKVRAALVALAATVLDATQEHIKALAIARGLGSNSDAVDNDAFLAATWRVVQAERRCDELLRDARRVILAEVRDAPSLMLANDLAVALEAASDHLLGAAYGLRDLAFDEAGVRG